MEERMSISGAIDAEEKVTLRFQTSGRLSWVGVKEGDYVKKYQSIASIDVREVKKKLEKDLNDYLKTRNDYETATRNTYKDQVISEPIKRILEKTQYDLNSSVLDVEIQNLSVEYANLWTPVEGVVTRVGSPFAGVNFTPSQAEFDIVNPKTIYFSATADQSEVVKLKENMPAELSIDSYPEATLSGAINKISLVPKTGETNTVYEIKFLFSNDNNDYKYRIGMTGDMTFITKRKEDVVYIPTKFISSQNGKKYVNIKQGDREEKREIITGMETDSETEVISGLDASETVYD